MTKNIILLSDSYKYSQWLQYPPGTEYVYSYIESRGGDWKDTVFFGLQAFIKEYLTTPVTMEDIDEAEAIILAHGEPFNREGWEYIVNELSGKLPISIFAPPEGSIIPTQNVLVTVVNTDPKCYWLTSFIETPLLRGVWYPTTVATNSYESKKIILGALEKSGTPEAINFKLHDFGARGVSSGESAGLGGLAHLVNFMGTDTVSALIAGKKYYSIDTAGYSIPASEHSTITSWGRDNEVDAYRNMIKQFGKQGKIFACVSDSYDIFKACEMWGTELKQDVLDSGAMVVIRPDSGYPAEVVLKCLYILEKYYGSVTNDKGYRVLNNVRVIQGDGIDHNSIESILFTIQLAGFSSDNVGFGQGGALLQSVNRDTMKWAMKCSSITVDGVNRDVYKEPITDLGKRSKRGLVTLYTNGTEYVSGVLNEQPKQWTDKIWVSAMTEVYRDGIILKEYSFDEVRKNANK